MDKIGIKLLRTDVGDTNVTSAMIKNNASIGTEPSGHIIFSKYSKTGEGLIASWRLCRWLMQGDNHIKNTLKSLVKLSSFENSIKVDRTLKSKILDDVNFINFYEQMNAMIKEKGRILIRPSGTEPLIRILVETNDENLGKNILSKCSAFMISNYQSQI